MTRRRPCWPPASMRAIDGQHIQPRAIRMASLFSRIAALVFTLLLTHSLSTAQNLTSPTTDYSPWGFDRLAGRCRERTWSASSGLAQRCWSALP